MPACSFVLGNAGEVYLSGARMTDFRFGIQGGCRWTTRDGRRGGPLFEVRAPVVTDFSGLGYRGGAGGPRGAVCGPVLHLQVVRR